MVILVLTFYTTALLYLLLGVLWHFGKVWFHRLRLRYLIRRHRRHILERDHDLALEIDKAWDRTFGRAQLIDAVQSDIEHAKDLGFLDEYPFQDDYPRRAS